MKTKLYSLVAILALILVTSGCFTVGTPKPLSVAGASPLGSALSAGLAKASCGGSDGVVIVENRGFYDVSVRLWSQDNIRLHTRTAKVDGGGGVEPICVPPAEMLRGPTTAEIHEVGTIESYFPDWGQYVSLTPCRVALLTIFEEFSPTIEAGNYTPSCDQLIHDR